MDEFEKLPEHNIVWVQKWIQLKTYDNTSNNPRRVYISIHLKSVNDILYAHEYVKPYGKIQKYYAEFSIYTDVITSQSKHIILNTTVEDCLNANKLLNVN